LKITITSKYPLEAPIVELSSASLPMPLLRNKEKECLEKAKENLGKPQIPIIYEHIYTFIQQNMFIPCWKEMKLVATLCEGKGQLGCDEKEGVLHMRLSKDNYRQSIKLKVPPMYPEEGVQIEFLNSNFPPDIQWMFKAQAEEIARRCEAGINPDDAVKSQGVKLPTGKVEKKGPSLTAGTLKNLKHDVNILKQMTDLRVATTAGEKNAYYTETNAKRKEARKELRRLAKEENDKDMEEERQLREAEQAEMKALMKAQMSDVALPSLLPVAKYLVENYALSLPVEPCQNCKKPILSSNPDDESMKNSKSESRPMRTFCGHWLHWNCLDEWLTSPPFIRQCPVCDRRIWHPDWPEDHKLLEKAWAKKEEKNREVSDVASLLGF